MGILKSLLKWLAIVVAALAVVLFVGGYLLPSTFSVTRNVFIAAPPDKVYALVADPRAWKAWSVWNRRDPGMTIEYSGPASGAGAAWAWKSKSEGDGKMTFTAAEPGKLVAFDLHIPDFGTTSKGELRFVPEGAGTQVCWTMNGDFGSNPLMHWFTLLADAMTGKDFDAGLANLKALAEKA
jgi:uncharacterized protein YndB with AHSA1/START domain